MEKGLFTLTQPDFAFFLNRLSRGFENIDYILVGGVAVQAHIAHALTIQHQTTLIDLEKKLGNLRLQPTNDVNICLREKGDVEKAKDILRVCEYIGDNTEYFTLDENHVIKIRLTRSGTNNPDFGISIDDNPERVLNLRFHGNERKAKTAGVLNELPSELYSNLFDNIKGFQIPYCTDSNGDEVKLPIKTTSLENLILIKLAQGRTRDIIDITSLLMHNKKAGLAIDGDKIRRVLSKPDLLYGKQNPNLLKAYEHFQGIIEALGK